LEILSPSNTPQKSKQKSGAKCFNPERTQYRKRKNFLILFMIFGARKVYKVLVGKPKGKRPLGRPRHR
jgi:hypothetical protein